MMIQLTQGSNKDKADIALDECVEHGKPMIGGLNEHSTTIGMDR